MPKFEASSSLALRTPERDAGRIARRVQYVVFVEVDDGSWCELDADDAEHARALARNWVDKLGARGCSCWRVRQIDGKPAPTAIFNYYWTGDSA